MSGPVTFTPENWDQPQAVTLNAPTGTAPHTAVINLEVTGGDATYLALDLGDVNVAVGDPATTITLTPNPDQPTTTKPTSVTATLTADVGTPTGGVVFRVDGVSACDCDTAIVDGVAQYNLGRLPPGTYTVTATYPGDATHHAGTAIIELDVKAVIPEPEDDAITIPEDAGFSTIDLLANDADADALTIQSITQPANGVASCDPVCGYRANPDFHGTDSFTYTVTEGTYTATATVTVTVEPVNDPPVGVDDAATVTEDTDAVRIDVVGNDGDVDGDTLAVADHTEAANGEVACDESSCTYTPGRDFHGTDTFTYTASDGVEPATATVTVTVTPVNDPPAAAEDAATTGEDAATTIEVVANDGDVDGDTLAVADHTEAANGEVACDEHVVHLHPGQ